MTLCSDEIEKMCEYVRSLKGYGLITNDECDEVLAKLHDVEYITLKAENKMLRQNVFVRY